MISAEWVFPAVQSLHFIGFALSIGTIAIVDLRLLGWGMRRQTAAELAADLNLWTNSGLAVMLITGPLMFSTDSVTYHYNPSFQFKMICLTEFVSSRFGHLQRRAKSRKKAAMGTRQRSHSGFQKWPAVKAKSNTWRFPISSIERFGQ